MILKYKKIQIRNGKLDKANYILKLKICLLEIIIKKVKKKLQIGKLIHEI